MSLSNREWEVLQRIDSTVQALQLKVAMVEARVNGRDKRERLLVASLLSVVGGIAVYVVKGFLHI